MIHPHQAERLRAPLLALAGEPTHDVRRWLARLDAAAGGAGVSGPAALLWLLTRLSFGDADARRHWQRVAAERRRMTEALGRDVGLRVALTDYFVNLDRRLARPVLRVGELAEGLADLRGGAGLGPLTAERLREQVTLELARARRHGHELALVLLELDGFDELEVLHGERVASRRLALAARTLAHVAREVDLVARPGAGELALLMPETSAGRAARLYERFRLELPAHGPTFSAGVADYPGHARTADRMFERAAEMLYRARAEGGDRCHVYPTERRRTPRLPASLETLAVELLEPADGTALRPRDVSRDGFGLRLEVPLPVGARVRLRLSARDRGESVDVHGRVVRARRLEQGPPAERYEIGVGLEPPSFPRVDPVAFCRRAERSPDGP